MDNKVNAEYIILISVERYVRNHRLLENVRGSIKFETLRFGYITSFLSLRNYITCTTLGIINLLSIRKKNENTISTILLERARQYLKLYNDFKIFTRWNRIFAFPNITTTNTAIFNLFLFSQVGKILYEMTRCCYFWKQKKKEN